MAGIEVATGEFCEAPRPAGVKVPLKRIVMWWVMNGAMLPVLYFALFGGVEWCQNLVKFVVWVNFILWLLIGLSGPKGWRPNRAKGFPVPSWINGAYGIIFCIALACFGWFGYAGMEMTTLVFQQVVYFGDYT